MKAEFKIATMKDVEGIIDLCNECFEENNTLEYALEEFQRRENDPDHIYVIGIVDEKIVAHGKITVIPTMYSDTMNTFAILNHICVKPDYRKHGLATGMLDFIVERCKEKECTAIKLWSNDYREAAHGCYKQYGFTPGVATYFNLNI